MTNLSSFFPLNSAVLRIRRATVRGSGIVKNGQQLFSWHMEHAYAANYYKSGRRLDAIIFTATDFNDIIVCSQQSLMKFLDLSNFPSVSTVGVKFLHLLANVDPYTMGPSPHTPFFFPSLHRLFETFDTLLSKANFSPWPMLGRHSEAALPSPSGLSTPPCQDPQVLSKRMVIFLPKLVIFCTQTVIFCQKLQKVANFSQKIIQTLVFLGQFNAFLKKFFGEVIFSFWVRLSSIFGYIV